MPDLKDFLPPPPWEGPPLPWAVLRKAQSTNPPAAAKEPWQATVYRGVSQLTPTNKGHFGQGLTFATKREIAERYAGTEGRVIEGVVRLENPYIIDATTSKGIHAAEAFARRGGEATTPELKAAGYDGVVVKGWHGGISDEVVAFYPTESFTTSEPPAAKPQGNPIQGVEMSLSELIERVTKPELDSIVSDLSFKIRRDSPVFWRDKTKEYNVAYLLRWAARARPEDAAMLRTALEEVVKKKAAFPTRGPVPGTRYLSWAEFTALPSYPLIEQAVTYPHDYRRKSSPVTKDGYVSVDAIYNMSAWASWKSSSLGEADRRVAEAIHRLRLGDLMQLNHGRRMDQPALFPEGMLPTR